MNENVDINAFIGVCYCQMHRHRRLGQGARPPKIREKNFFGQLLCKIRAFWGKNHVKFGNFVKFSGKYYKNLVILLNFLGKNHVKFGHFVNFSYIFFGQNCRAP